MPAHNTYYTKHIQSCCSGINTQMEANILQILILVQIIEANWHHYNIITVKTANGERS